MKKDLSVNSYPSVSPSESDQQLARSAARHLSVLLSQAGELSLQVQGKEGERVSLPEPALRLLSVILHEMAQGHSMALVPVETELTTQQAAEYLNVSRPYLIRLLDEGKIPCRKVGTHRRVRLQDVKNYKEQIDRQRLQVLDQLSEQAQKLNMGY